MSFKCKIILCMMLLFLICGKNVIAAPDISGQSAVLLDVFSGQVLFEKNKDEKLPPASTTKVLTAIMAIESGRLDEIVTIGAQPPLTEGTAVYLQEGEKISLRSLVEAALIHSANDAAVAIAEYLAGSEEQFASQMNEKARALGAKNSNFVNAHGLSAEDHYTTAYDLALIGIYALRNETFSEIIKQKVLDWEGQAWQTRLINKNELLWKYKGADGIKTGYTREAKNTIIASATKMERSYIAVILASSAPAIWDDAQSLLDHGFNEYKQVNLAQEGEIKAVLRVGEENDLQLVPQHSFAVSIPNSASITSIQSQIVFDRNEDRIEAGETVGRIIYHLEGQEVGRLELVTANAYSKPFNIKGLTAYIFSGIFCLQIIWRIFFRKRIRKSSKTRVVPRSERYGG